MTDHRSALFPQDFFDFIERHRADDPTTLRLKHHGAPEPWMPIAINHIESLRKCGRKFGALQPEVMAAPLSVEQASSAAVACLHADVAARLCPDAAAFLDMTCGLGIDFRAISERLGQGCQSVAIELKDELAEAARYNFRNRAEVEVINTDSVTWLAENDRHFDLVFIDPARRDSSGRRLYNIHDCMPDVAQLLPTLRVKADRVMVKLSPMLDVAQTLADLPCTELHVVDESGDCRELLAVLDFTRTGTHMAADHVPVSIHTSESHIPMTFTRAEEQESTATYGIPVATQWLFEPSPAAMKAAPYSLLSKRHALTKLHVNTHLYFADVPDNTLPGTWHEILEVLPFSSSMAKQMARKKMRADVAVRNFPLSAADLSRRLCISGGGELRIVGVTATDSNRYLVILKKH